MNTITRIVLSEPGNVYSVLEVSEDEELKSSLGFGC